MSRRTSESNKAIALAWENEQKRVSEGKGTRDWSPEQQNDILERGKAYDDEGKAFRGHHMRSVSISPEEQGNPDNIQFLSHEEHIEAHVICWQPTNWYYDPITKQRVDFGDGPIIPCPVIDLSQPIRVPDIVTVAKAEDDIPKESAVKEQSEPRAPPAHEKPHVQSTPRPVRSQTLPPPPSRWGRFWNGVKTAKDIAVEYVKEHKTEFIIGGLTLLAKGAADAISNSHSGGGAGSNDSHNTVNRISNSSGGTDSTVSNASNISPVVNRNYPETHASPQEHMVPAHGQHYHTNNGVIWKDKDPYPRGGNNSNK